jgi:hypothetical protein
MRLLLAVVMTMATAACQIQPSSGVVGVPPELNGRIDWPGGKWRAAALGDLQANGTVSLIDAVTRNARLATTASGATGAFSLGFAARNISLAPGYYWLEAVRFSQGFSNAGISLRTIVHFNGAAWRSVTGATPGDPVVISPLTTAVARLRALDAGLTDAEVMGVVTPGNPVPAAFGSHLPAKVQAMATEVTAGLVAGADSAGDLAQPVTVSPMTGTPGITRLTWTGLPTATEEVRQAASGTDLFGRTTAELIPVTKEGAGWWSTAPADTVGTVSLQAQIGSLRTAPVTWTAQGAGSLRAFDTEVLAAAPGPAGPAVVYRDRTNGDLEWMPLGTTAPGAADLIVNGGTSFAAQSTAANERHLLRVANGLEHVVNTGGGWSAPTAMAGVDTSASAPQLAVDGSGGLWAAWRETTTLKCARYTGGAWTVPETVSADTVTGFQLIGGAVPQVVYRTPVVVGSAAKHSDRTGGVWSAGTTISGTERVTALHAAMAPNGDLGVVWANELPVTTDLPDQDIVFCVRSGGTWRAPEPLRINPRSLGTDPQIAFNGASIPFLFWRQGDTKTMIHWSRRSVVAPAAGVWALPRPLDTVSGLTLRLTEGAGRIWLTWLTPPTAPVVITTVRGLPLVW